MSERISVIEPTPMFDETGTVFVDKEAYRYASHATDAELMLPAHLQKLPVSVEDLARVSHRETVTPQRLAYTSLLGRAAKALIMYPDGSARPFGYLAGDHLGPVDHKLVGSAFHAYPLGVSGEEAMRLRRPSHDVVVRVKS